jgi:undecaprenyl-diphosphatase
MRVEIIAWFINVSPQVHVYVTKDGLTGARRTGLTAKAHAMLEFIAARDHSIMHRVHGWHAPRWIRLWMICATRGGDGWLWYAMAATLLLFGGRERFAAVASAGTCALQPHCWATLLPPDHFSFPSGHSITAFAVAVPLALFYPSLAAGLLFCALSIAASRVILGMHFVSDVLAGISIGSLLGYAAYVIYA